MSHISLNYVDIAIEFWYNRPYEENTLNLALVHPLVLPLAGMRLVRGQKGSCQTRYDIARVQTDGETPHQQSVQ